MGFISTWLDRRSSVVGESTLRSPAAWLTDLLGGMKTAAGVKIDEHNALQIASVWACIRAISEDVAKLPIDLFRRGPKGEKTHLRDDPAWRLLNVEPNTDDDCHAFTFRETLTGHAISWGRGIAEIVADGAGRPEAMHIIEPHRVRMVREDGRLLYEIRNDSGRPTYLTPDRVFHVKGLSYNGIVGYSVIAKARESLGLSTAADQFGAKFFAGGAKPSGVLQSPNKLSEKAFKNLQESIARQKQNPEESGGTLIFEEGLVWNSVTMPPDDAQFLQTRQFQVPEVCRWFRMPPHKIFDLTRSTNNNIEHQSQEYINDTLMGWMCRWENEAARKLIVPSKRTTVSFAHNTKALLRGDLKSRYEAYGLARQWGWYSANDVLRKEDEEPLPGDQGDLYVTPVNMTTPDKIAAPTPEPAPAPAADPAAPTSKKNQQTRSIALVRRAEPAFRSAIARILRFEADKARRAVKGGTVNEWMGEFFPRHLEHVRDELLPLVQVLDAGDESARTAAMYLASQHVERSRGGVFAGESAFKAWEDGTRAAKDAADAVKYLSKEASDDDDSEAGK